MSICTPSTINMSKNTLFNYFTRSPASEASKKNESPINVSNTPKRPLKDNSITPKSKNSTPKSANRSSKKENVNNGSSKKDSEKRKPKQLGINLFYYRLIGGIV